MNQFASYKLIVVSRGKKTDKAFVVRSFFDGETLSQSGVRPDWSFKLEKLLGQPDKNGYHKIPANKYSFSGGHDKTWWDRFVDELYALERSVYDTKTIYVQEIAPDGQY